MIKDLRLLVALGVTGAAALALEVIWSRALMPWVGGMAMAQVATVGIYMLGLFAGSAVASRTVETIRDPRKVFLRVEAAAALLSVLMILGLPLADPLFRILAQGPLLSGGLGAGLRGLAGGSLIFPATFLMGFGFPMAIAAYQGRGGGVSSTAWVYGVNTVGGALGALVGGFVLVPGLGILWGSVAVVVVDLLVLYWAGQGQGDWATRRQGEVSEVESERLAVSGDRSTVFEEPAMLLAVFLGGFVALGLEVMLFRILGLILGPTARAFTVVVSCYVLGLGLGAMGVGSIVRKGNQTSRLVFIGSWILAGTLVFFIHAALGILPRPLSEKLIVEGSSLASQLSIKAFIAALLLIPLTSAFGAAYAGAVGAGPQKKARRAGFLYASLTLGNVLGLLAAALWILPEAGLEGGLILLARLALLVPLLALVGSGYKIRASVGLAVFIGGAVVLGPRWLEGWNWKIMNSGPYLYRTMESLEARQYFLFLKHDFGSTVAVMKEKEKKFFSLDGKVDGSNTHRDMVTQSMTGLVPAMFHPNPEKVLVIGLGTGQTVAEVLKFPAKQVDCAEILPGVAEILPFFREINNGFWTDKRFRLLQADGRTVLRYGARDYDVIASEPSNVWVPGVAQLFTREAFVEARESLRRPNGIFCQWLHAYRLQPKAFKMVLRAFLDVFPHVMLWTTAMDNYDVLMVGSLKPIRISQLELENRLFDMQVRNYRVPGRVHDAASFLRTYVAGTDVLRESVGPGPMVSQSRPRLEYMAESVIFQYEQGLFDDWLIDMTRSGAELLRGDTEKGLVKTLAARAEGNKDMRRLGLHAHGLRGFQRQPLKEMPQALGRLVKKYPDDLEILRVASLMLFRAGEGLYRRGQVRQAEEMWLRTLEFWPGHRSSLKSLSTSALARQDFVRAHSFQKLYEQADPGYMPKLILGDILRAQGRYLEAVSSYQQVLEQDPQSLHSLGSLVTCFMNLGMRFEALRTLGAILRLDPRNTFAANLMKNQTNQ